MRDRIKIKISGKTIKGVEDAAYRALEKTAFVLQDEMREEQVIPRKLGTLQGEAFWVDTSTRKQGFVRLVWSTPYARRLYYHPEYHFHREPWTDAKGRTWEGNPNAQGLWARPWMKGGKYEKRPAEIFEALLKREL